MAIEYPDLEIRNEEQLVAQAVALTSGGLNLETIDRQMDALTEIRKLVQAGTIIPICPELTNANPSAPHTVILEAQGWLLAQLAYRFNRVPEQNFIAFANLFGIERRAATPARTILRFETDALNNASVTIPLGSQVSTADGTIIFETISSVMISSGETIGEVIAERTVTGQTLLAPNVLTEMIDEIAFVRNVTNPAGVDSGTEAESVESTLARVKTYQRRGERLVSTQDLEDAILEALDGNCIVRAFPFTVNGNFDQTKLGYTTIVAMTKNGDNLDDLSLQKINVVLRQAVGNQFISIVNPFFVEFDISVNVRLKNNLPAGTVLAAIERSLRAFYAPSREQFGRAIYRSEIIAIIEAIAGVERIVVLDATRILTAPVADRILQNYELPKLGNITVNIV